MKNTISKTVLSKSDIELIIEQKLMELLGDPDSGLQLKDSFVKTLNDRLKKNSPRVTHQTLAKKYG